jgi:hypothetical protein
MQVHGRRNEGVGEAACTGGRVEMVVWPLRRAYPSPLYTVQYIPTFALYLLYCMGHQVPTCAKPTHCKPLFYLFRAPPERQAGPQSPPSPQPQAMLCKTHPRMKDQHLVELDRHSRPMESCAYW